VIRGQQYVTEVIAVGEDVKLVEKGDVAVVSMYWTSRNNKNRARKIISEGDILNYKKAAEMKRHYHLTRRHFSRE
jgi:threonine dehydrogenase-like Zn-dependent dehydrogenase